MREARSCTLCAADLPHAPRPVFRADAAARVAVIGQAPGAKVHASGVPWDDASGQHLCEWLDVEHAALLGERFAILPMGFCWPGRRKGGDLPPARICAPTWHPRLLGELPDVRLTLLVGSYAVERYLQDRRGRTLADTVRDFRTHLPQYFPLPHPSWRSRHFIRDNPWFEAEVLPALRTQVAAALA